MAAFRFIHTADIHLDSPLRGLAGHDGSAAERIRGATREALDNLVGMAIEEQVAFLVIAGDLYDGDWRDYHTGLFFIRQMGRLAAARIPVFVVYGNHDAESHITKRLTLPDNVTAFQSRAPHTVELKNLRVALHGQSFRQRAVEDNLVPGYPAPRPGVFNIGILHTGLGGMGGHADYAPCTLDDLVHKGYDYWALGHVHQAGVLHERPHVVFPGNLQGRHIRETGAKGALLVTVEDGEVQSMDPLCADVVRWTRLVVDATDSERVDEVLDRVREALESAVREEAEGRLLACRVEIRGRTAVHGPLLAAAQSVEHEAQAAAAGLGDQVAWIEQVVMGTVPVLDAADLRAREDALGLLQRMLGEAASDPELLAQLDSEVGEMVRRLPPRAREEVDDPVLQAAVDGDHAALIAAAADYLTARITAEDA